MMFLPFNDPESALETIEEFGDRTPDIIINGVMRRQIFEIKNETIEVGNHANLSLFDPNKTGITALFALEPIFYVRMHCWILLVM